MPNPLPDSTVSILGTNETAALAAAMIVAGSFPDIVSFAARVADASHKVAVPDAPKPQRASRGRPKRGNGRDRDAKLAALIRDEAGVTIAEMSRRLKAAPNTVRASLERLESADAIERDGKSWRVAEPRPPVETAKWTAPVSAQRRRVETEEREDA
jgi:hypothetical protein